MKKYILISCLAILGLTVACTGDKKTTDETTAPENGVENTTAPVENVTGEQQPATTGEQPVVDPAVASPAPAPGNVATIPNPAHGEPKHRCEVPVGTPIPADGSAPAASAQASQPQNIQMQSGPQTMPITAAPGQSPAPAPTSIMNTPAQPASTAGTTAPGMNPPHGEPGHDCAIPVGQPLKK
jgi:hypothetical protein